MKFRGYALFLSAAALVALAVPAFADKVEGPILDPLEPAANCDLAGYKSFEIVQTLTIPDNNPNGVTGGPIITAADGSNITDLIFEAQATHTWVGDLVFNLRYDQNCDGTIDAQANVICRPRGTDASQNAPCGPGAGVGCSSNLVVGNVIRITDNVGTLLADGTCAGTTANIPAGCYRSSTAGLITSAFGGRPKGGCWYLNVSDWAGADVGSVSRWAIHILNSPTSNLGSSWGAVKTLYR
jgi:subtilisin-like proprotein convertase family protein